MRQALPLLVSVGSRQGLDRPGQTLPALREHVCDDVGWQDDARYGFVCAPWCSFTTRLVQTFIDNKGAFVWGKRPKEQRPRSTRIALQMLLAHLLHRVQCPALLTQPYLTHFKPCTLWYNPQLF